MIADRRLIAVIEEGEVGEEWVDREVNSREGREFEFHLPNCLLREAAYPLPLAGSSKSRAEQSIP